MIDYEKLKEQMLTNKHQDEWAAYLIEELPNYKEIEKMLSTEVFNVLRMMYQKGYQDCMNNLKMELL